MIAWTFQIRQHSFFYIALFVVFSQTNFFQANLIKRVLLWSSLQCIDTSKVQVFKEGHKSLTISPKAVTKQEGLKNFPAAPFLIPFSASRKCFGPSYFEIIFHTFFGPPFGPHLGSCIYFSNTNVFSFFDTFWTSL